MSSPTQSPPPIKGSWEDLIQQALLLDDNRNAEAFPIFEKLISRLQKMPEAKLQDRDQRLQRILEASCLHAGNLNNSLGRFDEALKCFAILHDVLPDGRKRFAAQAQIRTLEMLGHIDEAISLVRELSPAEDDPVSQLVQEFGINLDARRFDAARDCLAKVQEALSSDIHKAARSKEDLELDIAQAHSMLSILALELQDWQIGIDEFEMAKKHNDSLYAEGDYLLYSNLVHRGQSELALPIIETEPLRPRRKYWQGLAHFYLGNKDEASAFWEDVVASEIKEDEIHAYIDLVLTHFYLGDKERIGLELILRMLNELDEPSWQLLYFAAIGWAIRQNKTNTRINLEHAIDIVRRDRIGRHLPWTLWPLARDLLSQEMLREVQPYFDDGDLAHYFEM